MGLSVERVGSVGSSPYVSTVQNSYAINNRSEISDAFVDSVKTSSATGDIQAASPVQYANAKNVRVSAADQTEEAQRVSRAYNSIAQAFTGLTTSYGADSIGAGYSTIGSNFDAYA